jgi:hypothetical protein
MWKYVKMRKFLAEAGLSFYIENSGNGKWATV